MKTSRNTSEKNAGQSSLEMMDMRQRKEQHLSSVQEADVVMRKKTFSSPISESSVAVTIEEEAEDNDSAVASRFWKSFDELHLAIARGSYESCKECLNKGMDVNSVDEADGSSALHVLGSKSRRHSTIPVLDIARLLIMQGAKLNAKDFKGNTPLHIAASEGLRDYCNLLLDEGERTHTSLIHCQNKKGMTPLHLASRDGQCEVLELLLKRGAKADSKDFNSWFPLHFAANIGCIICCRALMPYYAGDESLTEEQESPLMVAARGGHYKFVKELPADKVNVSFKDKAGNTALHIAAKRGFDRFVSYLLDIRAEPDPTNVEGCTPLMAAVAKDKVKCMEVLIERGASLNKKRVDESNVLHIAASNKSCHCMASLLKKDEVVKIINDKNREGYTPLALAIQRKSVRCIKFLEEAGASPVTGNEVETSIIYNSPHYRGSVILQERLLREKNVNFRNESKMTPLHVASLEGNSEACKNLLRKGARIDACDKDGRTPLHLAAQYGHERVLKLLLKHRASKRIKDDKKFTPLHYAAFMGKLQCCKILLETDRGLIKQKDKKLKYALDVAYDQGRFDVFTFLLEKFSETTRDIPEDLEARFHSYAHKILSAKKEAILEAVVNSKWWEAALGLTAKRMHGDTPCLLFRDIVKAFPALAYNIMSKCHFKRDFRLLEDNFHLEAPKTQSPSASQRASDTVTSPGVTTTPSQGKSEKQLINGSISWKLQHPIYTMISRQHLPLLQHPLTRNWVTYKWRSYARNIFMLLMISRAFTITTLVYFLFCTRNHKSNTRKSSCNQPSEIPEGTTYFLVLMGISFFLQMLEQSVKCVRLRNSDCWKLLLLKLFLPLPTLLTFVVLLLGRTMEAYHIGIVALVWEGLQFIVKIDVLPSVNILSGLTRDFICKYLKGLACAVCIVTLFAFIFYLLFLDQEEFKTMRYAMLSISLWQMGDFNQDIFYKKNLQFPVLSHIWFIAYLCTFGAFIVTLVKAPSTTKEIHQLNKVTNMINLILEVDICFPCARKWFRSALLRDNLKQYSSQKKHHPIWKICDEKESEEHINEMLFMSNDLNNRCRIMCKCEEKNESRTSLLLEKLETLTEKIKNLQDQMDLLQPGTDH